MRLNRSIVTLTAPILAITGLFAAACLKQPSPPPQAGRGLSGLPISITVPQRTTTAVPGAEELLSLTIDDVTGGQVMVSLLRTGAGALVGPISMAEGYSVTFEFDGRPYDLRLDRLSNFLVGNDSATFTISDPSSGAAAVPTSPERDRIEHLIQSIATVQDAVFIRNGEEHSPAEAAAHIRSKWRSRETGITSVEQFIEEVATRSSQSGEPYLMRFSDGHDVEVAAFLRERLAASKSAK